MEENKLLLEKWSKLLDAKGENVAPITEKETRNNIATLLENEEKWINENTTAAGDLGQFTPILVPTVRRIFPALVANQIVGVQPMTMPTGYAFAWRASYAGTNNNQVNAAVNPLERGDISNSIQGPDFQSIVVLHSAGFAASGNVAAGDEVRSGSSGGGNLHGTVKYVEVTDGYTKVLIELNYSGGSAQFPISTGDTIYYQTSDATGRTVDQIFDNEIGYNIILRDYAGPHTTATGESLGDDMESVRVHMERASVEAKTRKLKAEYTLEMAQDLKAVHNMDAEAELMNVLQYEIAAEIDRDLVAAINDNATSTNQWVYGNVGSAANTAWHADGQWELEKLRSLYTRILKEANRIAVTTRRGPGNYIICSTNVVSALEGLSNFLHASVPNDVGPVGGVTKVGTLDGRLSVYVDTFHNGTDYITVGYKGASNMDTGVVYCPYVPIMMQKITHEKTFQPAIGTLTRSAIAYNLFGTNNFYRKFNADFTNSQLA